MLVIFKTLVSCKFANPLMNKWRGMSPYGRKAGVQTWWFEKSASETSRTTGRKVKKNKKGF